MVGLVTMWLLFSNQCYAGGVSSIFSIGYVIYIRPVSPCKATANEETVSGTGVTLVRENMQLNHTSMGDVQTCLRAAHFMMAFGNNDKGVIL